MQKKLALVAWIGEDELSHGGVGLKQGVVPAGRIPLVAIESQRDHMDNPQLFAQLQAQADRHGKVIRLARFEYIEDLIIIKPRPQG